VPRLVEQRVRARLRVPAPAAKPAPAKPAPAKPAPAKAPPQKSTAPKAKRSAR